MDAGRFVERIVEDEGLTSDLDEAEATRLIQWLTAHAEAIAHAATDEDAASSRVTLLVRTGRAVAETAAAFRDRGIEDAKQLASAKKLQWPDGINASTSLKEFINRLLQHNESGAGA